MTISDEISIIANQLANKGTPPSVALIKSQLSNPTPLPTIIAVLKSWQHDPAYTSLVSDQEEEEETSELISKNEDVAKLISQAVLPLQQELQEIKNLLTQLVNNK